MEFELPNILVQFVLVEETKFKSYSRSTKMW